MAPRQPKPTSAGSLRGRTTRRYAQPTDGVYRYILTSAQNNTPVFKELWDNLLALVAHYDAVLLVGRFTYDKSSYGAESVKPGTFAESDLDGLWYDPEVLPHVCDDRVELAPGLVWCGELNILPTAQDPLSGLESYAGRVSIVVPHAKFAMTSVASARYEATKLMYTTGTVTLRNYIQKKAGLKAEEHHGYGAVLVEVLPDGSWFVRQLMGIDAGSVRDLTLLAEGGRVTDGHRVEGITWGDVHRRVLNRTVRDLAWGPGGMLDALRPRFQFVHDGLDFRSRNHHDAKNSLRRFSRYVSGQDSVKEEVRELGEFFDEIDREWCETVAVDSNHDRAFERWVVDPQYSFRDDPPNIEYYLEAAARLFRAAREGDRDFHLLEWAVRGLGHGRRVNFLRKDRSFVLCRDHGGGIECGMHGDLGVHGAKGSIKAFARMGRRSNVAHSHSAGIYLGVFQCGTSTDLDLEYNDGLSRWSNSHIVTYPEATRSLVTMWKGRWRG